MNNIELFPTELMRVEDSLSHVLTSALEGRICGFKYSHYLILKDFTQLENLHLSNIADDVIVKQFAHVAVWIDDDLTDFQEYHEADKEFHREYLQLMTPRFHIVLDKYNELIKNYTLEYKEIKCKLHSWLGDRLAFYQSELNYKHRPLINACNLDEVIDYLNNRLCDFSKNTKINYHELSRIDSIFKKIKVANINNESDGAKLLLIQELISKAHNHYWFISREARWLDGYESERNDYFKNRR